MGSINVVVFEGRFTADPELRAVGDAKKCSFTLAQNQGRKGSEVSLFLKCEAWDKQAEAIDKHFKKGHRIQVVGQLKPNRWTTDAGDKREILYLRVNEFYFADKKESNIEPDGNVRTEEPEDIF